MDIKGGRRGNVEDSLNKLSLSPPDNNSSFLSNHFQVRKSYSQAPARTLKPFASEDIKILLLENVNQSALSNLKDEGYQVEFLKTSMSEDDLVEKIKGVHAIGIRSKTRLTRRVLEAADSLIVIGCFCIGTNQVDLDFAAERGIAVFNSPYANSRSVAELVIGYIISLARQVGDRSLELHRGEWNKVSSGCWEIRGKTLGIIGYGHIGSQLSVLAEAMGLHVVYYDILPIMPLGSAKQLSSLPELLHRADFVSLHVPASPETKNMISSKEFAAMKEGSYLINASRGTVVDIPALVDASKSGKIAGAAIDVYPSEPAGNGKDKFVDSLNSWTSELTHCKNIILTPHIGGSTEEAQYNIGIEVSEALTRYINEGNSIGAVNFPEVSLRSLTEADRNAARVLFVHRNVPGVLRQVNELFIDHNIKSQFSDSRGDIAYLVADISDCTPGSLEALHQKLESLPCKINTRLLY
ncbi:putative D-3-phosphoglycerate dehydrogenase [Schizosaccharomyces pombe]|uniref:Putative D-3-phosphoglycerate dehydrogenase n=1 Tax=Schizosaccharomyces pombe (strain 972 / ATCC 24843) TaxID=284812 RepID=SERA_SCHPO|nr:putative D-3 phosphoglycerate dehydrogenase [Schizosaccharomyces pombe]P87228.1 RecName: Full=Putative D-3-phosphoglycerate dehydrogenase; Short=3-PGDH; AltName: Full=2-oxoglutarate reductase [Schizosaccharomyces pombe 972h-]CAB09778.1 D-3 phosphoglycerate dehydrogenase (predicted) [Schizosaccharomyces pombe]|eukprot:NP_587837.1 putative D-3 phosphoglycerate dehydrogenase [Schizosaccharomyces pombe]